MDLQYKINFENPGLSITPESKRPISPANTDTRSMAMRAKIEQDALMDPTLYFISMGSGSSGNCYYVGNRHGGVIVDAGIKAEIVESTLKARGIPMEKVKGVLLTHDHTDHSKYIYQLLKGNRHLALYCTNRVLNALLRRHGISRRIKDYHKAIFKEIPFKIAGFEITAFDVPHDAADSCGYFIDRVGRHFVIATDLGEVAERARFYTSQAHYLVIEANYDSEMLERGPYPQYLKARIRTPQGHLDNCATAAFLSQIAGGELSHIWLCHLSQENNTPEKALSAVREALQQRGLETGEGEETLRDLQCPVQLMALPRLSPTRLYVLRPRRPAAKM